MLYPVFLILYNCKTVFNNCSQSAELYEVSCHAINYKIKQFI